MITESSHIAGRVAAVTGHRECQRCGELIPMPTQPVSTGDRIAVIHWPATNLTTTWAVKEPHETTPKICTEK